MTAPRPRVTLLSGPSGAGKTTLAALLGTGAPRATVTLTTDHYYRAVTTGFVAPYLDDAGAQNTVVVDAVVASVATYARGGYDVVVDGVVGPHFLPPFVRAARSGGWDLRYVVLRPDLTTTLARGTARSAPELTDAGPLREVHAIFADLAELEPHAVDTGDEDPDATAERLRAALDAGGFALTAPAIPAAPDERVEPPLRGDEVSTLRGFLDHHRDTLRRKTADLDAGQLATALPPSSMTLGGLLKHLAYVESHWFTVVLAGADPLPPFDTADWTADRDWEWHSAADDSPAALRGLFDDAVAASDARLDAALAGGAGPGALSVREHRHGGGAFSVRWILAHMVEEYARHNGHADLLREALDGAVGE